MFYQSIGAIDCRAAKLEWQHKIYIYVILLLQESSCVFEYFNGILMIVSNFEHGW